MRKLDVENIDTGYLRINCTTLNNIPIENVNISIYYEGEPTNKIEELKTNNIGQTENIALEAPPVELSQDINNIIQPYSDYAILAEAEGFEPVDVSGIQILSDTNAVQNLKLRPKNENMVGQNYAIPPHTLYGEYPPKIAEAEVKPVSQSGEIVLSRVVVPEYVVVHDGPPSDSSAKDHYVLYRDYIKNVASSEIYATWPEETIRANVLAIMSFTLNRVYTEW